MQQVSTTDKWLSWLTEHRHGGDEAVARRAVEVFGKIRDKVLDRAELKSGETLLDLGTGDGLIAFGALDRVQSSGKVIFTDISQPSLDHCKLLVAELDALRRTAFIRLSASDLSVIPDETVDVVTTRSVLIYEPNKRGAFREMHRVLRRGGRVSIFEPIASVKARFEKRPNSFMGYDMTAVKHLLPKIAAGFGVTKSKDNEQLVQEQNPMIDFDERDLVHLAQDAGFSRVDLDVNIQISNVEGMFGGHWDAFYHSAPNPNVPTLAAVTEAALTATEREEFIGHLRPLVEQNKGTVVQALAYLMAVK